MADDEVGGPTDEPTAPATRHRGASATAALTALERRVIAQAKSAHDVERELLPAWLRPTKGEHRWQMGLAVISAIALQLSLPAKLTLRPHGMLPALEAVVLVLLILFSPARITKHSMFLHSLALILLAVISIDNACSAGLLVHLIVAGHADTAGKLLLEGVSIWLVNIIAFALWYWEFDRGGPVPRAFAERQYPDLLFPQMQQPEVATPDWEPTFFDYFFVSFTNATAFSPTDTMPLSRWTKALFLVQSAISLVTVALVISRAVNVFKGS
jgi:uncharacterized membrane protein